MVSRWIFDIINKIWRYKFFDNDYVNKIFGGALIVACSWLILKVVIELVMNYIVKMMVEVAHLQFIVGSY